MLVDEREDRAELNRSSGGEREKPPYFVSPNMSFDFPSEGGRKYRRIYGTGWKTTTTKQKLEQEQLQSRGTQVTGTKPRITSRVQSSNVRTYRTREIVELDLVFISGCASKRRGVRHSAPLATHMLVYRPRR